MMAERYCLYIILTTLLWLNNIVHKVHQNIVFNMRESGTKTREIDVSFRCYPERNEHCPMFKFF